MKKLSMIFIFITSISLLNANSLFEEAYSKEKATIQLEKAKEDEPQKYNVFLGSGEQVKLSQLADKMENHILAEKLRFGELSNIFLGSLIASIVSNVVFDITGVILFSGFTGKFGSDGTNITWNPLTFKDNVKNMYGRADVFAIGVTSFVFSGITLGGIITFALLLANSSKYNFSIPQASSLINQYNNYMKKKLKKQFNADIKFNNGNAEFCFSYKL